MDQFVKALEDRLRAIGPKPSNGRGRQHQFLDVTKPNKSPPKKVLK